MSDIALRTIGLGKTYLIGGEREAHRTMRDTLAQAVRRPIERLRHPGAATHTSDTLWALKDFDLEVTQGEAVGVIGPNGAGKSTLLKVLSHITEPTEGRVEIRGRLGSLLEVGTGFHPELTGRENILLNGAILGMSRAEIKRKFDEIVEFSEVGRFLETPIKRYSSGMYVRLAFAVAAHLEPEVLAVDEVLAVGDASFQRKCMGKMGDMSRGGRTILFVSHNLTAIRMLCGRAALLDGGRLRAFGKTEEVLDTYMAKSLEPGGERSWATKTEAPHGERVWLRAARVLQNGNCREDVDIDKPVQVEVDFVNESDGARLYLDFFVLDAYGATVLEAPNNPEANTLKDEWFCRPHRRGVYRFSCTFPGNFFNEGRYFVSLLIGSPSPPKVEMRTDRIASFEVVETGALRTPGFPGEWYGVVRVPLEWRGQMIQGADG